MPPRRGGDEERDEWLSAVYADAETHSAPPVTPSARGMPWIQLLRHMADTKRCRMGSPRQTLSRTLRVRIRTA